MIEVITVKSVAGDATILRLRGRLILTKPLGTGTLFAADMRMKANSRWIDAALAPMVQSNRAAARYLHNHDATACTDVTGSDYWGIW